MRRLLTYSLPVSILQSWWILGSRLVRCGTTDLCLDFTTSIFLSPSLPFLPPPPFLSLFSSAFSDLHFCPSFSFSPFCTHSSFSPLTHYEKCMPIIFWIISEERICAPWAKYGIEKMKREKHSFEVYLFIGLFFFLFFFLKSLNNSLFFQQSQKCKIDIFVAIFGNSRKTFYKHNCWSGQEKQTLVQSKCWHANCKDVNSLTLAC